MYIMIKTIPTKKLQIRRIKRAEEACKRANLNNKEQKIIDHIRYVGVFTQPSLTKAGSW